MNGKGLFHLDKPSERRSTARVKDMGGNNLVMKEVALKNGFLKVRKYRPR